MTDLVNHPDHYGGGDNPYEVIKVLRAWDLELAKGFCWGNVIKYTARAERKGNLADYKKADWYAAELVSIEEELATRVRKEKKLSDIPVIIPGAGHYRLEVDWEKRTHKLVNVGGGGAGNSGSANTTGGIGGSAAGGAHWPEPVTRVGPEVDYNVSGDLSSVTTVKRCNSSYGCVGGYHGRKCPLHIRRSGNG